MNKTGLNILLAACALTLGNTGAYASTSADGYHRDIYGWFLSSSKYGAGHYGYAAINMSQPEDYRLLYEYDMKSATGQFAGAAVDGIYYGCEYILGNLMMPPVASAFVKYNLYTGVKEEIGEWNSGSNLIDANFKPLDMTYDYHDATMYAVGFLMGTTSLYTVDLDNGRFTKVVDLSKNAATIAADAKGDLYSITLDGWLYKINKSNGAMSRVFNTGRKILYLQSMEFDLTTGKLYWASNMDDGSYRSVYNLMEIDMSDPDNITISDLGVIDNDCGVEALYIPYAEGGLDAPAAPSDIKAITLSEGSLNTKISWTNPTTTFGGEALDAPLTGVVIFRDDKQVGYVTGDNVTDYTDTSVTEIGEHRYDIVAVNAKGLGGRGTVYAYLGEDVPAPVKNLTLTPGSGCGSVTISWDAVTEGYHGGLFSKPEEVRYNVTRKPDNFKVAEGIKETSVTDNTFSRVLNYSYVVEAVNEIGSTSATSAPNILGPASEAPYEEYFDDDSGTNKWTAVDANDDGFTWLYNTDLGFSYFGSYDSGFEYIVSPTLNVTQDADEWLISPPFKFEKSKDYELAIFYRTTRSESLKLHVADTNLPADMGESLCDIVLPACTEDDIDPEANCIRILTYVVPLPEFNADVVKCIGLHLDTPLVPQYMDSFLQINGFGVDERGSYVTIREVASGAAGAISLNGRRLHVGDNAATSVYTITGVEVLRSEAADIDLSDLPVGIYVIRSNTSSGLQTVKVVLK